MKAFYRKRTKTFICQNEQSTNSQIKLSVTETLKYTYVFRIRSKAV